MASPVGRKALVKMSGSGLAFTGEAVTVLTTNKKYQITDTTKRVWDQTATITVLAAGVDVDPVADPYVINRLTGTITFTATTARGTVTVTGTYLPMSTVAKAKMFSYALVNETLDDTNFDSGGKTERIPGIMDITGSLGRNYQTSTDTLFHALIVSGGVAVLQIFHTSSSAADILAWVRFDKQDTNVGTHTIIDQDIDFVGVADADGRVVSIA